MSPSAEMPGGDSVTIDAFRRLLESSRTSAGADSPVLLTDRLVGPLAADLLRQCAVPHEFDSALLAFIGGLDAEAAEQRYVQFTELALVQIGETSLSVHERWREPLWRWWLADAQRAPFVALSERLVHWFTQPASLTGEDPAARRRMFHLLGCRHDEGMAEFDRLFRTARHRRRFSECSLLLRLVAEYNVLLSAEERALLRYHEGKIAMDLRQWEHALPLLRSVADDPLASTRLRVNAQARIGHGLRQLQQADAAHSVLMQALARVDSDFATERSRWRVLYELGEVERDLGQLANAADTLSRALALANDDGEVADAAGVLNSLGTVQLKLGDIDAAIASFDASLFQLRRRGDALRPSTVLNNLGLARMERCDWAACEAAFAESLQIKRAAGDVLGQATTLLNLGRTQAAQGHSAAALKSAEEAARLFERDGDARRADVARQAQARLTDAGFATHPSASKRQNFGLPWWAWLLTVLGVLLLALLAFGLATGLRT